MNWSRILDTGCFNDCETDTFLTQFLVFLTHIDEGFILKTGETWMKTKPYNNDGCGFLNTLVEGSCYLVFGLLQNCACEHEYWVHCLCCRHRILTFLCCNLSRRRLLGTWDTFMSKKPNMIEWSLEGSNRGFFLPGFWTTMKLIPSLLSFCVRCSLNISSIENLRCSWIYNWYKRVTNWLSNGLIQDLCRPLFKRWRNWYLCHCVWCASSNRNEDRFE